jgi:hypothetical protein
MEGEVHGLSGHPNQTGGITVMKVTINLILLYKTHLNYLKLLLLRQTKRETRGTKSGTNGGIDNDKIIIQ